MNKEFIDEIREEIEKDIIDQQNSLESLDKLTDVDKHNAITQCERLQRKLENQLRNFHHGYTTVCNKQEERQYKTIYNDFNDKIKGLKADLDYKKVKIVGGSALFGNTGLESQKGNVLQADQMSGQQMIDVGYKIQDKSREALLRAQKLLLQTDQVANIAMEELEKQNDQILRIQAGAQEHISLSAKAKTELRNIAKKLATDKIILCMILLIIVAIIVIIVVSAVVKT